MLVPARQVGTQRTAGPILQNEPTDGGVSGGVGRSTWWPSDALDSAQAAAAIRYIYTLRGLRRFLLGSAHLWGTDISFWLGPNLKSPRLDARPSSAGRRASHGGFTTRLHWKG
jgi:hypothetical protein